MGASGMTGLSPNMKHRWDSTVEVAPPRRSLFVSPTCSTPVSVVDPTRTPSTVEAYGIPIPEAQTRRARWASVLSPTGPRKACASTAPLAILEHMSTVENNHETTRPGGITGNGFKPGQSGNPGGRPKGIAKTVRDACGGSPLRLAHGPAGDRRESESPQP